MTDLITEEMILDVAANNPYMSGFEARAWYGFSEDLNDRATKKVQVLVDALDGIQETYAGMDGFVTETAPEAYQGRIIQQMYEIAKQSLKEFRDAK